MATLTRSVELSPLNQSGIVLPLSKLSSIAVLQSENERLVARQKLYMKRSPIGGLEFGWRAVKSFTAEEADTLKPVRIHGENEKTSRQKFRINEPELWIRKPISKDFEMLGSLLFDALVSGLGFERKDLFNQIRRMTNNALIKEYRANEGIDKIFLQLMKDKSCKDQIVKMCRGIETEPHINLGLSWDHVRSLSSSELLRFQKSRPFWATDMDSVEEILQIPPSDIFVVMRDIDTTWLGKGNLSWIAAEKLGYSAPASREFAVQQLPIVEVKQDVSLPSIEVEEQLCENPH
jgi:hypothetical protein